MKILVVEDSRKLQKSLSAGLRRLGYAVDIASDGEEGVAFATTGDYDVIVLDLMLPKKPGLEVLQEIRRSQQCPEVLILSARDQTRDRINGLQRGADDYLVKPFSFDELHARIQALVTLTKYDGTEVELDFADEFMPEFESLENPEYFELFLGNRSLLERSHSFDGYPDSRPNPAGPQALGKFCLLTPKLKPIFR